MRGFSCDKEIEPIKFGARVRYVRNDYTMTHLKMLTTIGDALTDMFASISPVLSAYVILFLARNYTKENSRSLIFERAIRNQEMFIHPQNTTRHFIQIKFKLDNHVRRPSFMTANTKNTENNSIKMDWRPHLKPSLIAIAGATQC